MSAVAMKSTETCNVIYHNFTTETRPQLTLVNESPELQVCDLNYHPVDAAQDVWKKRKSSDELVSVAEINIMVRYFLDKDNVRDALIFIIGCNTGLRISDILWLRWKDVFVDRNRMVMQKTGNVIDFYPNEAVMMCAELYKKMIKREYDPEDYIFISEGPNVGHTPIHDRKAKRASVRQRTVAPQPLRVETMCRTMTKAGKETGLASTDRRISTHTGRKTHANALDNLVAGFELGKDLTERAARIHMAQTALGHAKAGTTIGHYLASERILHEEVCKRMNFGLDEVKAYCQRKGLM